MKAKHKKEAFGLLLVHVLLILSFAQGRMLLSAEEAKVQYFEGGLVLRLNSPPIRKMGMQRSSEPERILRSVPSPGMGH
jgi:hypothetical protein